MTDDIGRVNAVLIAPEARGDALHDFIERRILDTIVPDNGLRWNLLPKVNDIRDFDDRRDLYTQWVQDGGEGKMPEKAIPDDIDVVIIPDVFFNPKRENEAFVNMVAWLSQYCFVGIILFDERKHIAIQEAVDLTKESYAEGDYYFIKNPKNNPVQGFQDAIRSFIAGHHQRDVANRLQGDKEAADRAYTSHAATIVSDSDIGEDRNGRVIAVTASKGGAGKSTVSLGLASYLARSSENSVREGREEEPLKVCLVDIDSRDGQIGLMVGYKKPNVAKIFMEATNSSDGDVSAEAVRKGTIYDDRLKVDLILAMKKARRADDIPIEFYRLLINRLRKMYDVVIMDTSVNYLETGYPLLETVVYPEVDAIILVSEAQRPSLGSSARWLAEVTSSTANHGMGIDPAKVGLVLNKVIPSVAEHHAEDITRAFSRISIISALPNFTRLMAEATRQHNLALMFKEESLRNAFNDIATAVVGDGYDLSENVS